MYDTWKSLKRIVVVVVVVVYSFVLGSQKLFIIRLGVAEVRSPRRDTQTKKFRMARLHKQ